MAFEQFGKAAIQDNPVAQGFLGVKYSYGRGVEHNAQLGYMWTRIAADGGNQRANKLSVLLERNMKQEVVLQAKHNTELCLASRFQNCR